MMKFLSEISLRMIDRDSKGSLCALSLKITVFSLHQGKGRRRVSEHPKPGAALIYLSIKAIIISSLSDK